MAALPQSEQQGGEEKERHRHSFYPGAAAKADLFRREAADGPVYSDAPSASFKDDKPASQRPRLPACNRKNPLHGEIFEKDTSLPIINAYLRHLTFFLLKCLRER